MSERINPAEHMGVYLDFTEDDIENAARINGQLALIGLPQLTLTELDELLGCVSAEKLARHLRNAPHCQASRDWLEEAWKWLPDQPHYQCAKPGTLGGFPFNACYICNTGKRPEGWE
ncbi:hypothetical protein KHP57_02165 [Algiphilus sp. NNCM1]|jgi:hypothetical protein|uniref:hypothetical protein n=1 Tax=Algiphilus sp. TaxID=1872431 RepID=UPI001CA68418|nr:hypothetical protein [Algiphilus sp.]MBY8964495.1 hypothetical protein [Algiphilus acroporae]MCI5062345.1 hypothetical protein [Algiphilus sp.]MCI5103178.1 hypothetical protein [Algiphilus sp.]MCK5770652.1 hypothetical protein [Algiphilus sp.]